MARVLTRDGAGATTQNKDKETTLDPRLQTSGMTTRGQARRPVPTLKEGENSGMRHGPGFDPGWRGYHYTKQRQRNDTGSPITNVGDDNKRTGTQACSYIKGRGHSGMRHVPGFDPGWRGYDCGEAGPHEMRPLPLQIKARPWLPDRVGDCKCSVIPFDRLRTGVDRMKGDSKRGTRKEGPACS